MKCAEACGEGALSLDKEPTWDITENATPYNAAAESPLSVPGANTPQPGGWHQGGVKAYYEDSRKCRAWKLYPEACNAGRCFASCTFTKYDAAAIHEVVAATLSTTPVFNGFFRTMDDVFGYGLRGRRHDDFETGERDSVDAAQESWWDLVTPIYGVDTTIGAKKGIS
jgi:hypothetical protein